jgi:hypothetical protein
MRGWLIREPGTTLAVGTPDQALTGACGPERPRGSPMSLVGGHGGLFKAM